MNRMPGPEQYRHVYPDQFISNGMKKESLIVHSPNGIKQERGQGGVGGIELVF